ncbi:MAG: tRNA pseudouridine(13) synthase TruD [Candidatus Bathyarchaeota archaeon]|nr:tRNA pseudouridine(13) synthase TruD [Candidatus Bathyarchaeota archaeon]
MRVPEIDRALGIEVYATSALGIGGVIRSIVEDFAVEEVLVDGSRARIEHGMESHALGASLDRQGFLLCVLVKRDWDTFLALKNIARQLGVSPERIGIAGIKDAKAVTAQHITIERGAMEAAAGISIKDVEVRPVGYFRDKLSPYYTLGNSFRIVIRAVKLKAATVARRVAAAMRELEVAGGIPNFFGHQRFGTARPITHVVGKALVKGDFEEAAMRFLAEPSCYEHPASRLARSELQATGDFKRAFEGFPKQLRYERLMLGYLVENPRDFVGAFKRLPVKLQVLFVQAYQSYLFNRFLSERLLSGLALDRAEIGDYVVQVERSGLPVVKTGKTVDAAAVGEVNAAIKAGKMRVALPLVGVKQRFSQGVMGEKQRRILEAEGVKAENFKIDALPELSGRGELRAVVAPVRNFRILDIVQATDKSRECRVAVDFMLLRGSYATVLLRELMKPREPVKAGF